MQSVNDDMDDLFRRAARDYPLYTGGADWDKVAGKLHPSEVTPGSKWKNKRLLWLLLLIPFSLICKEYFVDRTGSKMAENKNVQNRTFGNSGIENKTYKLPGTKGAPETRQLQQEFSEKQSLPLNAIVSPNGKEDTRAKVFGGEQYKNAPQSEESIAENRGSLEQGSLSETGGSPEKREWMQLPYTIRAYPHFSGPAHPNEHQDIAGISEKAPAFSNQQDKRFYLALLGGMDATSIKFQKVENVSFDLGVLLGYKISQKWGAEGGLFLVKKYYYTKGEYFNTSKIQSFIPPNSVISEVSGNCIMWEVPLSMRYNFKVTPNRSVFATAGVSSYLMNQENYNYVYLNTSTGQTWEYYKSYSSSSRHLVSSIQLSGGTTFKLGKSTDLRLEPYVKLPLKGVGIGSIPMQSIGIHVGLSRDAF